MTLINILTAYLCLHFTVQSFLVFIQQESPWNKIPEATHFPWESDHDHLWRTQPKDGVHSHQNGSSHERNHADAFHPYAYPSYPTFE